jgi:DNA-binding response OmpR family regulator
MIIIYSLILKNELMEERIEDVSILLCEDDENLGMLLREYLEAKGYKAELCVDGEKGYQAFVENYFDLCILDVMMPKMDGFTLASKIREVNPDVPFMFLTAKTLKEDVLEGFKIGADDYITKPFSMEEVVFRIEAILRRVKGKKNKENVVFQIGRYTFDSQKQLLSIDGESVKLTTKEADLLTLFCKNANQLIDRAHALHLIWRNDTYFSARSMDVYITKLRKLLQDDPNIQIINVHGKGYKLLTRPENEH